MFYECPTISTRIRIYNIFYVADLYAIYQQSLFYILCTEFLCGLQSLQEFTPDDSVVIIILQQVPCLHPAEKSVIPGNEATSTATKEAAWSEDFSSERTLVRYTQASLLGTVSSSW